MTWFRLISIAEGISLITLLFVAMPLRTLADMPMAVTWVGWIHGILFLNYAAASLIASHLRGWSIPKWLLVLGMGVVPFGFIYVDRMVRRETSSKEMAH
ncbi:DUF3817 domain-containing protein [Wenzhouxiangella sp. AB-CW3]|uniref:DUF3817 domain-containing protein n=1 Tax=Wenzhouxiangella sp. AB-CW3 TaxID=2771012 RepID=UPI00168A5518|nr:DUF3817 domain-containing protein [Wenzhouxiangella sp. AB-CW3]QOC22119.1 DUF3817 domain-containing protein [Wenzhouxiangella sp. AB-CW3]